MKKLAIIFLFASSLGAQVQIGKNVQIGAGANASPFVSSLTTTGSSGAASVTAGVLNIPNYTFSGITSLTGDGTATGPGAAAFTLATVNSSPGSCGDSTHVCQVTTNGKGLTTAQTAVSIAATGAVASVANSDSTLTITPTTGSVVASLNLGHANTWTAPVSIAVTGGQGGTLDTTEGTAPSATAGHDILYADSTSHCIKYSANGGAFACIPTSTGVTVTIASGTSALGTSAIASGACATVVTTTATGVASTDAISWNPNGSIKAVTGYVPSTAGGLTIAGYPTTNAVNWDVCNWTAASITPGALTLNWRVVR